jgi:hypothetical protein
LAPGDAFERERRSFSRAEGCAGFAAPAWRRKIHENQDIREDEKER